MHSIWQFAIKQKKQCAVTNFSPHHAEAQNLNFLCNIQPFRKFTHCDATFGVFSNRIRKL